MNRDGNVENNDVLDIEFDYSLQKWYIVKRRSTTDSE